MNRVSQHTGLLEEKLNCLSQTKMKPLQWRNHCNKQHVKCYQTTSSNNTTRWLHTTPSIKCRHRSKYTQTATEVTADPEGTSIFWFVIHNWSINGVHLMMLRVNDICRTWLKIKLKFSVRSSTTANHLMLQKKYKHISGNNKVYIHRPQSLKKFCIWTKLLVELIITEAHVIL